MDSRCSILSQNILKIILKLSMRPVISRCLTGIICQVILSTLVLIVHGALGHCLQMKASYILIFNKRKAEANPEHEDEVEYACMIPSFV